jgi:hypothetical protein
MTGERPRGYRAPTYKFSRHTLTHLVNEGFVYDASLMGDDVPYLLDNATGRVVELPSHYALDDWPHFMASRDFNYFMSIKAPRQAMEVYAAEFDAMWEYGGLWIAVWHPFLSGRLARCVAIAELIEYMHKKGRVLPAWTRSLPMCSNSPRQGCGRLGWTACRIIRDQSRSLDTSRRPDAPQRCVIATVSTETRRSARGRHGRGTPVEAPAGSL